MTRLTPAAVALWLLAAPSLRSQGPVEIELAHMIGGEQAASARVLFSPSEVRVKSVTAAKEGAPETELVALLQRTPAGWLRRYDREVRQVKDRAVVSTVSIVADDEQITFRETGTIGSRTRTLAASGLDGIVDGACHELLIPFLLDPARKSVRVLVLPELESHTVVLEDRGEGSRFAAIPGGGVTLFAAPDGAFRKLVLPGPAEHVLVRTGSAESRPGPSRGRETPVVLKLDGGVALALTLTLPAEGDGPHPGVLLLGDAGARDRNGVGDGTLVPTLRLLADELAGAGIASVRADKRGVGGSYGPEADLGALVSDARNLLDVLELHPAVDGGRIFVAGHGEGAIVAAMLAAKAPKLAGVIALAAAARPLPEALEARLRVRLARAGESQESVEGAVQAFRAEIESLQRLPESAPAGRGQALLRDLAGLAPATLLARIKAPLLVIHAGDDREVPASQVALLRASLAFSGLDRARFEMVEGADHDLLVAPKSAAMRGSVPEPADVARELHPRISALIREFIGRAAASRPAGR